MEIAGNPHVRIVITRHDGKVFDRELTYPRGHPLNPMTKADVDHKLAKVCAGVLSDDARDALADAWWGLEAAPDVSALLPTLADFGVKAS